MTLQVTVVPIHNLNPDVLAMEAAVDRCPSDPTDQSSGNFRFGAKRQSPKCFPDWFTERFDTADVQDAKVLLDQQSA